MSRCKWTLVIAAEALLIVYFAAPLILRTPVAFIYIKSDSMSPVLKKGDIALICGYHKDRLLGKVIAYKDPISNKIIVHRAIRASQGKGCYITKGDNSLQEDFFQPCTEQILGWAVLSDKTP